MHGFKFYLKLTNSINIPPRFSDLNSKSIKVNKENRKFKKYREVFFVINFPNGFF